MIPLEAAVGETAARRGAPRPSTKGNSMLADFGVGQVLWSLMWFFLFFVWIMLLFQVFIDIFRSPDLGGFAKTMWVLFVVIFPYLGVFVYLIARGGKMAEHRIKDVQTQQAAMDDYVRQTAGSASSPAAELERLASLKEKGVIDDAEFQAMKAKVLS
jgi:hypothetical protein